MDTTVDHDEQQAARSFTPGGIYRAAKDSGGLPFAVPPASFLLIPVGFAWYQAPGPGAGIVTAMLAVYGVLFVFATGLALYPLRYRLAWFAVLIVLLIAMIPLMGENVLYMIMFQAMTHVLLLPWRWAVPTMVGMCLASAAIGVWLGVYVAAGMALVGMMMAWGIGAGIRQQFLQEQLDRVERRNAVLAVAAERERIGRDLHDLLGHSLTSLTISAQLARRLLDTDPDAAKEQLAHIETTLRQALAEVRATSSGMQTVRAASELATARTVLGASGVSAHVPTALPAWEDERSELFGYVIREAVTNVMRHARAERVEIDADADAVTVRDDGVGIPAHAAYSGLAGLERRLAEAGGTLEVSRAEPGTRVRARLAPVAGRAASAGPTEAMEETP